MEITNTNRCLGELQANTLDPLKFLATIISSHVHIVNTTNKIQKISRKNMISYEEIRRQMIKEFLKTHKFTFHFPNA